MISIQPKSILDLLQEDISIDEVQNLLPKYYVLLNRILLIQGDITNCEVDVIVNAANSQLLPGGGVCGSIFRAASSKKLLKECIAKAPCTVGEYKATEGYNLPCKKIFHTVGPQGEDEKSLKSCYMKCLDGLVQNNLNSIAFPCISTGIYGFDSKKATKVVVPALIEWLGNRYDNDLEIPVAILLVCYLESDYSFYLESFYNLVSNLLL